MTKSALFAAIVLAAMAMTRDASAQLIAGTSMEGVSPYLSLLQGGNQFGVNLAYQALLQPLADNRKTSAANNAGIQRLQSQVNGGARGGSSAYGKHYMNYSHFYTDLR